MCCDDASVFRKLACGKPRSRPPPVIPSNRSIRQLLHEGTLLPDTVHFLAERTPRPLTLPRQGGLEPKALFIGQGQNALEVAVVAASTKPSAGVLQAAWK